MKATKALLIILFVVVVAVETAFASSTGNVVVGNAVSTQAPTHPVQIEGWGTPSPVTGPKSMFFPATPEARHDPNAYCHCDGTNPLGGAICIGTCGFGRECGKIATDKCGCKKP